jgi:hypothetical protein
LLCSQVVDSDAQVPHCVLQGRTATLELTQLAGLRDGRELVGQLVDPGVELLDVEQSELDERVGFQSILLL